MADPLESLIVARTSPRDEQESLATIPAQNKPASDAAVEVEKNDLSDIISEIKKKIEVSEAAEKLQEKSRQDAHSQHVSTSQKDKDKVVKSSHSRGSLGDQFKFVADAIAFQGAQKPKKNDASITNKTPILISRLDTHNIVSQPLSKMKNTTDINLQGPENIVHEQSSLEEYSQLDMPLSRIDSHENKKADLRVKTAESKELIDDDHAASLQNMKNTAAKMAGVSRAESALQPRDVKSPLV